MRPALLVLSIIARRPISPSSLIIHVAILLHTRWSTSSHTVNVEPIRPTPVICHTYCPQAFGCEASIRKMRRGCQVWLIEKVPTGSTNDSCRAPSLLRSQSVRLLKSRRFCVGQMGSKLFRDGLTEWVSDYKHSWWPSSSAMVKGLQKGKLGQGRAKVLHR